MTLRLGLTRAAIAATATAAALAVLPAPAASATVPAKSDAGSLRVTAQGVPQGGRAKIVVARKDWRKKLPSAGTLKNLKPGTYRVWATPIVAQGGTAFVPNLPVRVKVPRRKSASLSLQYQWNPKNDVYPPGPVRDLQVSNVGPGGVSLRWTNSVAPDLQEVAIRRKQGTVAPTALDDGRVVPLGTVGTSVTDTDVAHLTTYSYSVFMVDSAGNASSPTSVTTTTKGQAVDVTAGTSHTCALLGTAGTANGQVACWGANSFGQLGNSDTNHTVTPTLVSIANAVQVVAGADHTCARLKDASVWCWGKNDHGQLGNGTMEKSAVPVKVNLPGGSPTATIAAGGDHTCAVSTAGNLRCWGDNESGQSGQRPSFSITSPPAQALASGVSSVAAGWSHTCFVRSGQVRCLGVNTNGQLGNGSTQDTAIPVTVSGVTKAVAVTAGVGHTCSALQDKSAVCWGANAQGQIGDGTTADRDEPVVISGLYSQIVAGAYHTCALSDSLQTRCWGRNGSGRLGDGTTTDRSTPARVLLAGTATRIAAGGYHSCAVTATDSYCWGANPLGQVGSPVFGSSLFPAAVTDL